MRVYELVMKLKEFDQELDLSFRCTIESGRSFSSVHDGSLDLEFDPEENKVVVGVFGDEDHFE